MYAACVAMCVWMAMALFSLLLMIFIPLLGALALVQQFVMHGRLPGFMQDQELLDVEENDIMPLLPAGSTTDTIRLKEGNLHRFLVPGQQRGGPVLVLCHGTFANAFGAWHPVLHELQPHCSSLHVLDLPGFGRSAPNIPLNNLSGAELMDFLADVLCSYSFYIGSKPTYIGLSIGACVVAHAAVKYPESFGAIVLSSTAGMLPTLGRQGAYYALLFKLGIPFVVSLGRLGLCITYMLLDVFNAPKSAYYDFNLRFKPDSINDLPKHFIDVSFLSAVWKYPPLLPGILCSRVPVGFIHGKEDTIMPPHIGRLVASLFDAPLSCCEIDEAWHVPECSHPKLFCEGVAHSLRSTVRPGAAAQQISQLIDSMSWSAWRTPYSTSIAQDMVDELYSHLTSLHMRPRTSVQAEHQIY
jgi:pimeloyl-ACP methyl ester carboxylesterase